MLFLVANKEILSSQLKWQNLLPPWAIAIIIFVSLCWVYGCYAKERSTSSWLAKIFLGLLRMIIVFILIVVLCKPYLEQKYEKKYKTYVAFLLDSSGSMDTKDQYTLPEERKHLAKILDEKNDLKKIKRIDILKKLMRKAEESIRKLEKKNCQILYFQFDEKLKYLEGAEKISEIEAKGEKTDISRNIIDIINQIKVGKYSRGKQKRSKNLISGIFLLTDGQHNASSSIKPAVSYIQDRGIPVYSVAFGGKSGKDLDVILKSLDVPDMVLVDDKIGFEVKISHTGYMDKKIQVQLKQKGQQIPLRQKEIVLGSETKTQKIVLYYTFRLPGKYRFQVNIPSLPGESISSNNQKDCEITVAPKKLNVLYLEGLPRWEYRYLKNALIRDETVVANTWLYSADRNFFQEKSPNAPELQDVPRGKTLLENYDCVLIGDVSPEDLGEKLIEDLVKFAEQKGGGVIFLSGPQFNPSKYWDTPLNKLLPIVVDHMQDTQGPWTKERRLYLTHEGKKNRMLILDTEKSLEENLQLWQNPSEGLPGFYWHYKARKVKPGATVLTRSTDTNNPIMVTHIYGKGRTFFNGLDSTWRWRYIHGDRYFYRFWGQVIRHVAMRKVLTKKDEFLLEIDKHVYKPGKLVKIKLHVPKEFLALNSKAQNWTFHYQKMAEKKISEDGSIVEIPVGKEKNKKFSSKIAKNDFQGYVRPKQTGIYRLWFLPPNTSKKLMVYFKIIDPKSEKQNTKVNDRILNQLASEEIKDYLKEKYKKKELNRFFLKPYELEDFLSKCKPRQDDKVRYVNRKTLWDSPWLFLLLIFLFTLEWVIRKLQRML